MRAIPVTALTMLCLCFRTAAADERAADTTGDAAFLAMVNRPVVLEVQGAERVQVRENLPYRSVAGGALRADVPIIDLRVAKHLQQHLRPEQLEAYSAGSHLAKSARTMPPLLLIRAGRDQIPDLLAGVDRFVTEALAANAPLTLANLPDAPHGFDNGRADPRTLEVLRQTLAFLTTHLSGGTAKR